MKKLFILILTISLLFAGCDSKDEKTDVDMPAGVTTIEVVEHLNGGGYTFIKGIINGTEEWIAVREMPVENGDDYYFKDAMEMKGFKSKSLNRTFDSILFVNSISKNMGAFDASNNPIPGMKSPVPGHSKPKAAAKTDISVIPIKGGKTIEALVKEKAELEGKTVKIRGVVTKFNGGIMGRNWLHIQDGTSFGENIDITVISDQTAKVGDEVVIEGTLTLDKDFGSGYFYDMIIENAKLIKEQKI